MKQLYFGDCLDVLKELDREHPGGLIDLIYIDPPFNSKRDYNILFESIQLKDTKAQKEAFADTWSNVSYLDTLEEIKAIDLDLYKLLHALDDINISQAAVSYLTTMAIRIYYMHRVLKDTGSFYLHCDPTMSHYLKLVCDIIFSIKNFRNEIIWHYGGWTNQKMSIYPRKNDIILFYTKSNDYTFNPVSKEWTKEQYIKKRKQAIHVDEEGREYIFDIRGNAGQRRYLDVALKEGQPIDCVWDISPLTSSAKERLGYPTQKPEALLERIVAVSSKENDLVADFFCGCGTTIAAAETLKRNWIGADISHLAIKLIVDRLTSSTPRARAKTLKEEIIISGFPRDVASAYELARNTSDGRFGFQDWIIEVMLGGVLNPKRTADGGWDGHITFDKPDSKEKGVVLIEVKSGNVTVKNVREFIQVVNKHNSDVGVFVCFKEQVTQPMLKEAKQQGYFDENHFGNRIDKIQILTVEDLLDGKEINLPLGLYKKTTFKSATVKNDSDTIQHEIFD